MSATKMTIKELMEPGRWRSNYLSCVLFGKMSHWDAVKEADKANFGPEFIREVPTA